MARSKHYRVAKKHVEKEHGVFIPGFAKKRLGKLIAICAILIFLKGLLVGKLLHN